LGTPQVRTPPSMSGRKLGKTLHVTYCQPCPEPDKSSALTHWESWFSL
jgi:hypothetical protein